MSQASERMVRVLGIQTEMSVFDYDGLIESLDAKGLVGRWA